MIFHHVVVIIVPDTVILSPPEVAPVCSGDELELTCTVPGRGLEWFITLMPPEDMTFEHPLNSLEQSIPVHTITVSNTSFTFSRISPPNSRPLISRLLISPATSVVNGTVVVCEDVETRTNSSIIRVNVVHNNSTLTDNAVRAVHIVNFTSLSELRGSAFISLSVLLQLNGINLSFPYRINIVSEERNIFVNSVGPILFELIIRYDTWYNVSIMVCGELSSAPLIGLYYSKCGTGPVIIDYGGYLQGNFDNINECPPVTSQAPTGPVLDFTEAEENDNNILIVAVVSATLATFLLTFVFTFILGCTCGICCCRKKCNKTLRDSTVVYEDVVPTGGRQQESNPMLQQNVAYVSVVTNP